MGKSTIFMVMFNSFLYQQDPTSTQTCQRVGTHGIFSTEAQSRPLPSFGFPEASPPGRIIVLGVPRV